MKHLFYVFVFAAMTACNSGPSSVCKERFGVNDEEDLVEGVESLIMDSSPEVITVPDYNPDNIVLCPLDYLYDSINLVRLETNEDCIIDEISFLEIHNDTIFVLDKLERSILLFDLSGNFINKISVLGSGPQEYKDITSISIDDNYVYIYDNSLDKVLKYTHNGDFVSSHRLKFFCQKVMPLDDGDMLCYGRGMHNAHLPSIIDYSLWKCDSTYSRISSVGLLTPFDKTYISSNLEFNSYGGRTFHFEKMDNVFCEILSNGKVNILFRMSLNHDLGEELDSDMKFRLEKETDSQAYSVFNVFSAGDNIIYNLAGNGIRMAFVYHKKNDNKSVLFNGAFNNSSQISRLIGFSQTLTIFEGKVVYQQDPVSILSMADSYAKHGDLWDGAPEHVREFDKKLLESLHEEDNPILVFAKIKEHFD